MVEQQFYTILTKVGKAKIANSNVLNTKLNLTKFQVGDGGGAYYNPTEDQTKLKNKVWEGNINSIRVDKDNPSWIVIEVVIPSNEGGFMIREAGIMDDEGNLIAVGKYPETFKPHIDNGSSKDLFIRMILEVSNTQNVTLKVDPTIIMATKRDIEVLESRVADIEISLNDNIISCFKTEDSMTTLNSCNGGFVNIEDIKGQTLVNLFKFNKLMNKDIKQISSLLSCVSTNMGGEDLVRLNGVFLRNGVYSFSFKINTNNVAGRMDWCDVDSMKISAVDGWQTIRVDNFKHNKSDLSIYNFLDFNFPQGTIIQLKEIMVLEGDWTGKKFPSYFTGVKSVGKPLTDYIFYNLNDPNLWENYSLSGELNKNFTEMKVPYKSRIMLKQPLKVIPGCTIQITTVAYNINIVEFDKDGLCVMDSSWLSNIESYTLTNKTCSIGIILKYNDQELSVNDVISQQFSVKVVTGYKIEILTQCENLWGGKKFANDIIRKVNNYSLASLQMVDGRQCIKITSTSELNKYDGLEFYNSFEPNTQYTMQFMMKSDDSTRGTYIQFMYNDGSTTDIYISSKSWTTVTVTSNYNKTIKNIRGWGWTGCSSYIDYDSVQLVKGTNPLSPHEPYKGDKTEVSSLEELRKISNSIYDSINYNGVIKRNCGQVFLSGREDIVNYSSQNMTNTLCFFITKNDIKFSGAILSDKLPSVLYWNNDIEGISTDSTESVIVIRINKLRLQTQDVNGFKVWLAQNPVTVVYQLATPTIENTNKTLDLRAYDNLIVNSGEIQPTVNYSYAKSTGERFVTIENTMDRVKYSVNKLSEDETIHLIPLNGFTNLEDYNSNKAIKKGDVVTLKIRINPIKVPFPYNYNVLLQLPQNIIPSESLSDFIVATDKGVMSLGVLNNGSIITHDIRTTEYPTYIVGTITYVI